MRLFYTFSLVLLMFTSCEIYQSGQYFVPPKNSLSSIPLRPHTHEVDVFFQGEKPVKPYYRVKIVEVEALASVSSDEMLKLLKQQAQKEGIDALMINDIGKQAGSSEAIPAANGFYYRKMAGIGLKYKDQIDYMGEILKEQVIHLWPDEIPEPKIFSLQFGFDGTCTSLKDDFTRHFFNYDIYLFEDHRSIYPAFPEWEYRMDSVVNVFSKRIMLNGVAVIRADYKLYGDGVEKAIILNKENDKPYYAKFELERIYNSSGLIIKKVLRQKKTGVLWIEDISYNYNGLPDKIKRNKIVNGREVHYFEIENHYYSVNDLPPTDN